MREATEPPEAQKAERRVAHAAKMREWLANLSPESREILNAKRRVKARRYAEQSPEALERARARAREYARRKLASMSPQDKAAYLAKRREKEIPRQRELRAADPDFKENQRARTTGYYWANRAKAISSQKTYRDRQKDLVFDHYGRSCACCGENEIVFLSIDHVAGDGAAHRRANAKRSGASLYSLLIKDGFPEGFQILCYNCNFAKRNGNTCPHAELVKMRLTSNVRAFHS